MSCMGNILMHLFLGKPHVGSTDPFLTPHAKVSTRRSDARQSQGNYEDWKPLLKKTCCCLFIQQFLDMLVEIKIECVGSTIIQFPPSRRHGWAITCALLCSPYHQLSIGNRSECLTCFLNIACDCEGSNMLYINLSCAWCFTFWLGLPMQTETTALASMLVPSWSPQWTKNMWKSWTHFIKLNAFDHELCQNKCMHHKRDLCQNRMILVAQHHAVTTPETVFFNVFSLEL